MQKNIIFDDKQSEIRAQLSKLSENLENLQSKNPFLGLFSKPDFKSFYIFGPVGCGKTSLLQDFYHSLKKTPKIYFHFNSFMRQIHENLRNIRLENKIYKDELIEAVKRIISDKKLLCFDEFQVLDIADAMLLGRIFSYLFAKKITVVFTSNSHPLDLYKNGLQREIFLEFINKIFLKNCEIIKLDNNTDYRTLYRQNLVKRYFVSNKKNRLEIKEIIKNLTKSTKLEPRIIKVWGREVKIAKTFEKIAIINFDDICKTELAASDYQAICKEFDLVILLKLPNFTKDERNEMRRFTLFIDEVYENKTALIILAKTKIDKIYLDFDRDVLFARTISRLKEIKSDQYWSHSKFIINS